MKPTKKLAGSLFIVLALCGLTLALVSWNGDQRGGRDSSAQNDTIPKKPGQPRDLDEVLSELENLDIQKTIEDAMKGIDMEKMKLHFETELKNLDLDKLEKELKESISKIDLEKVKLEMKAAFDAVDFEKIQKELKESFDKIDLEKMKEDIQKVKEIDFAEMKAELEKANQEMEKLGPQLEKEMSKAKEEMEKAKTTLREFKGFVDALDKEGLISKKDGYRLEHKNGDLFINGKKAPAETYNKYREFLQKHKEFEINQDEDGFDLDID